MRRPSDKVDTADRIGSDILFGFIVYIHLKKFKGLSHHENCSMVSAMRTTCSRKEFTETLKARASSAVNEATRLSPSTERLLFTLDLAGSTSTRRELYATVAWRDEQKGMEILASIIISLKLSAISRDPLMN